MKTLLRLLALVLIIVVATSSLTFAESRNNNRGRAAKTKKRGDETGFYSKQMNQAKYNKCPKFSTHKRRFK